MLGGRLHEPPPELGNALQRPAVAVREAPIAPASALPAGEGAGAGFALTGRAQVREPAPPLGRVDPMEGGRVMHAANDTGATVPGRRTIASALGALSLLTV